MDDIKKFSQFNLLVNENFSYEICERMGYYVYILKDPRNERIFYIGKGYGNRIFDHVNCAIKSSDSSDKLHIIRSIHSEGKQVEHYILRHGLTEKESFEVESACIELMGIKNITNIVSGQHTWDRGLKTVDEIIQHYGAPAINITEPSIIININRLYRRNMTPEELYEAVRSSWRVSESRSKLAKYAIASYRGFVLEVYKINGWNRKGDRWEFFGEIAEPSVRDKYKNGSLATLRHTQNPIRYNF
jgi:hypothetical protein